ncbi:MAG: Uma2 family endonuclease [Leptolyngbyaceae cyanobacterium]
MLTNSPTQQTFIPTLESGDRLTRAEFEHRYQRHTAIKKAELIEGVVYVASPVCIKRHAEPHGDLITWLGVYKAATPGITLGDNATVRLDLDNEPQPDGLLRLEAACGGQSRISDDDYIEGAPELVVEIAASSASYDLHDKLHSYRRNGVKEYLVWLVEDRAFRWYELQDGQFVEQTADANGRLTSKVFPGLWLAVAALLSGDMATVLAELQEGLQTEAHQKFATALTEQLNS